MQFKKIDPITYVIALAPGEEIMEQINTFLVNEKIDNAYFSGIGAVQKAELAHFRVDTKKYSSRQFDEPLEITNITGNAYLFEGKPLVHAHATLSDDGFATYGGHLVSAVISAACEITLVKLNTSLKKRVYEDVGLKLLDLNL